MTDHTPLKRHATRPKRRRVRKWIKRGLLGVAGVAAAIAIVYAWLPKPTGVDAARARRTTLAVEITDDGQTRVRDRFVVAAPASGMLERIEIEPGTTVERGDPIARITPPDPVLLDRRSRDETEAHLAAAIARVHRADTAIARATVARASAIREAARGRALLERGAIAGAEADRLELEEQLANGDLRAAQTERTAAVAEVAALRAVLEADGDPTRIHRNVVAPVSGRVLRVLRDSAGPVIAGAPLIELGDTRAIEVVVDVLSSDAVQLRPGIEASIEGWGGAPLRGVVRVVEPSAFTRISALGVEEQRVKVILDVDHPPASLGDGFRVDVRMFPWRGDNVLTVPASAVFRDHDRWALYVIEAGRARLRRVEIGHRGRTDLEITSGLAEGAEVIVHPSDRVTDDARVVPRDGS